MAAASGDRWATPEGAKAEALVVYESMFGNTAAVAESIARGLRDRVAVRVANAADSPMSVDCALLVVGGPTHSFTMSRPATRADAARKGSDAAPDAPGLREWLAHASFSTNCEVAAFDTRLASMRLLPGSAARAALREARRRGMMPCAPAESFWVAGTSGPLLDGELGRAYEWGRKLGVAAALQRQR